MITMHLPVTYPSIRRLTLSAAVPVAAVLFAAAAAPARAQWPLWDGKESVADYAKRAGIEQVQKELDLGSGVAMKLTLIPAGTLLMGSPTAEWVSIEGVPVLLTSGTAPDYEGPQREVTISRPFYMSIYEVTQEQYELLMGTNPSKHKGKTRPVEQVWPWELAAEFCEKLSAKTGAKASLPTEAQWEYACRAGSTTRFFFGDDDADLPKYANVPAGKPGDSSAQKPCSACQGKGRVSASSGEDVAVCERCKGNGKEPKAWSEASGTAPVGSFLPNKFGLYDMIGNVVEFCSDWVAESFASAPTLDPAGPGFSPPGTCGGPYHVCRHGAGSATRPMHAPTRLPPQIGIRVVVALKPLETPAATGPEPAREVTKTRVPPAARARGSANPGDAKVRVPPGYRAAAGTQAESYTQSGWAQSIVHEATGIEMVYVPAGVFFMGSPESEAWATPFEWPLHRVTLSRGFYMGTTEVTQGQWEQVMGSNPSRFKNAGREAPVEMVSWDDCQTFCKKAGGGLRLPTEAEWEYACRAGTREPYAGDLDDMGWYLGNSDGTTQPVGTKAANAWGLHDMHGNVWEWCLDRQAGGFSGNNAADAKRRAARYPNVAVTDPAGPVEGGNRMLRGGSWGDYPRYCRSAERGVWGPEFRVPNAGCRVVLDAPIAP